VTIHYELILLYSWGFTAREVVRDGKFSRGTAYRFHRIYREAILYSWGFTAREVVRDGKFSRGTAYRFHRIYREARKRALDCVILRNSVSPARERKANNLDHLKSKKRVSPREKWEWTIEEDGTTTARKQRET